MQRFFVRFLNFKIYLIAGILSILLLTIYAKQYAYFFFDLWITRNIQLINNPFLIEILKFLTWLGNVAPSMLSLVIVSGALFIEKYRKESIVLISSTLGVVAISETLKILVSRPRPDAMLINQVEQFFRRDSFPSGHVLFFMGFYGFLMFLAYVKIKRKSLRNLLVTVGLAMIILIGISRIYLGSHWFSDTLASYLIGSIWLYLVIGVYGRMTKKVRQS